MKLICALMALTFAARADVLNDDSRFTLEPDLAEKIYQSAIKPDTETERILALTVQGAYLTPSTLTLSNPYFTVPYHDNQLGVPAALLGVRVPVTRGSTFFVDGGVQLGYGFRESNMKIQTLDKSQRLSVIRLHWIPVEANVGVHFAPLTWLGFAIRGGAGVHYFYQSGNLDGLSQGFWISTAQIAPSIEFFGRTPGLPGIEIGARWARGLGSDFSGFSLFGGLNVKL